MKKEEIKVAYIVPVYNVNRYLEECLNSLLEIKSAKEVIIVDDRGSEDPYPIIAPFLKEKGFKYIKNEKNLGVGASRNIGVNSISMDTTHIYFVDSDDYVISQSVDEVVFHKLRTNISHTRTSFFQIEKKAKSLHDYWMLVSTFNKKVPGVVWGSFWCKEKCIRNPFTSWTLSEDALWVLSVLEKSFANDFEEIDIPTYVYRKRASSITNDKMSLEKVVSLANVVKEKKKYKYFVDDYSEVENLFFSYLKLKKSERKIIRKSLPTISHFLKSWISFSFFMQRCLGITFFENKTQKRKRKSYFE